MEKIIKIAGKLYLMKYDGESNSFHLYDPCDHMLVGYIPKKAWTDEMRQMASKTS